MKHGCLEESQKHALLKRMVSSARKGNLATSAIVLEKNKMIAASESLVVSSTDATAHAERRLVSRVCRKRGNNATPGLTLVTVVEPCLMCLSAAAWAKYGKIAYIIPAQKYVKEIPWMSDGAQINKRKIAYQMRQKVKLVQLKNYEPEFCEVFEKEMKHLLK